MGKSLNSRIDWVTALKAFGCKPLRHSLPTKSECPVCKQGRLRLSHDSQQGGAWAHCRACGFSGDVINLSESVWKCNTKVAVNQLQEEEAIAGGVTDRMIKERQQDQRVWDSGQELISSAMRGGRAVADLQALSQLGKLGIPKPTNVSWSASGPGQLFGYTQRDVLEDALRPRKAGSPRKLRPRQVRVGHVDADGQFIIPFFDHPDRVVSSYIFYAPQHGVWKGKDYHIPMSADKNVSGGLAFHPDTLKKAGDGKLLVTDNPETYLRLHLKSFQQNPTPLPLACYRSGETYTDNWNMFSGRSIVFWAQEITPNILRQVIRLDAYIAQGGPRDATIKEYISTRDPVAVVQRQFKNAKHWSKAVASLIEQKDGEDLADWISQLDLTSDERLKIEGVCSNKLRPKLARAFGISTPIQTVQMQNGYMEQRPTGWYFVADRNGESLITNCPFKILEATPVGDKCEYLVEAKLHGQEFTFTADMRSFERRPFEIIHEEAIHAGCGVTTFDEKLQSKGTFIAKQLYTPQVMPKIDRVGFDQKKRRLVLPHININTADGRATKTAIRPTEFPGAAIQETLTNRSKLRSLLLNADSTTPMSIFLAVATQVLCDICRMDAPKVGLQGRSCRMAAIDVSEAMGLGRKDSVQAQKLLRAADEHAWPFLVGDQRQLSKGVARTLLDSNCRFVLPVNRHQLVYGLLKGDMISVQSTGYSGLPRDELKQLGPLLVELVSYLCREDQYERLGGADGPLVGTYRLLSDLLASKKLTSPHLKSALRRCLMPEQTSDGLADCMAKLLDWGIAAPVTANVDRRQQLCWRDEEGNLLVNRERLVNELSNGGAPRLDTHDIGLLLSESQTSVLTQLIDGEYVWVVTKSQFDHAMTKQRRSGKARLSVVRVS